MPVTYRRWQGYSRRAVLLGVLMGGFFRSVVVAAADVAAHGDAIRRLRREEIEGILVRDVYDRATCAAVCEQLEAGRHGLVRTSFPAPFHAFFLGMNLNLAPADLSGYFAAAPVFRERLAGVFAPAVDLESRVAGLLSGLDGGRRFVAAPGPARGVDHMFTTLRAHRPGGFIPQHFDDEQDARPSYRFITPHLVSDVFSFVLAFSQAEAGGELEVFNLRHGGRRFRMVDGDSDARHLSVEGVESVRFRLAPGEMIVVNSGRYLHRVTPVVGAVTRWTACSFMAESRTGDVLCWG
jgi:hypothetical protein